MMVSTGGVGTVCLHKFLSKPGASESSLCFLHVSQDMYCSFVLACKL